MPDAKRELNEYQTDHDLLIRLDTRMADLIRAMDELKGGTNDKIKDHDRAITSLIFWRGISQGVGICVVFLLAALGWLYISYFQLSSTLDSRISKAITSQLDNYGLINTNHQ
jgi:hypothetical protein